MGDLTASLCPMLAFAAPSNSGLSVLRESFIPSDTARHSMGSPVGVPVPWHSRYAVRLGSRLARS